MLQVGARFGFSAQLDERFGTQEVKHFAVRLALEVVA
jgi:hypothetical protein